MNFIAIQSLNPILTLIIISITCGILYSAGCAVWVLTRNEGQPELHPPYIAIRKAAGTFLKTQYGIIVIIGLILFFLIGFSSKLGWLTAVGFAVGGICSGFSGAFGMWVSVRANVRTAAAAEKGLPKTLKIAIRSGSVTGFMVGSLAIAIVCGFYFLLIAFSSTESPDLRPLAGLGFGASLISIFARLGGGIFTKAADMGADLVGKLEQNIPEDDPRNPAVIADNVGDNVGDCAGMAADVFESYAITLIATLLVANHLFPGSDIALYYPLALGAIGIVAGIIGMQAVNLKPGHEVTLALARGVIFSILLTAIGFYGLTIWCIDPSFSIKADQLFKISLIGLALPLILLCATIYYTSTSYPPVLKIAHASASGHATNIIAGLSVGLKSTLYPTLALVASIIAAYYMGGVYGIAIAASAMLSQTPVIVALDAYGPVADNAGGIAEMAKMPKKTRSVTDLLDAAGNTTKASTKTFAIGSAGLAALVLFAAFSLDLGGVEHITQFMLGNPYTLAGLLIGSLMPFIFSGYILDAVGNAASRTVKVIRTQFQQNPGILSGSEKPDYSLIIKFLTQASLRGMIVPSLIPVVIPILIVFVWEPIGPEYSTTQIIAGLLIGAIISGFMMAVSMSIGGAAWDNAKKYIEEGHEGGKGSPAHQASITGDTVGDPYKDTAGPAINPMIKILNIVALLLVPFLA